MPQTTTEQRSPEPANPARNSARRLQPQRSAACLIACIAMLLLVRCTTKPTASATSNAAELLAANDCIIVAGERIRVGTRVVTWLEPDGYNAYLEGKHFDRSEPADGERRYASRRNLPAGVDPSKLTHEDLKQVVHQFVVHYDQAGCSRQCFKVLQDVRKLSVHFMLDLDGTIYQTLDLKERAWHATVANDFSVGIEVAHAGAWASPLNADMRRWYEQDAEGWRQKFPKWMPISGIRTKDFVARPDRPDFISGEVQGQTFHQFDFTTQQYRALAKLIAGLNRALPRIEIDAPRNKDGTVINHVIEEANLRQFDGIVGHFHVQKNKRDPGPAFQWERVLREARELAEKR
jgi:N-acetylmuramoyl-L-alanine amidase